MVYLNRMHFPLFFLCSLLCLFPFAEAQVANADATKILFIGDSHTVGYFGRHLDRLLRGTAGIAVITRAHCGTSPFSWLDGGRSHCGYFHRNADLRSVTSGAPARVPLLLHLLRQEHPQLTLVALGTNQLSRNQEAVRHDLRRMMAMIGREGSGCVWVGPPDLRYFGADRVAAFYRVAGEEAVLNQCHLIDSRLFTRYPARGGDGLHYNDDLGPQGRFLAMQWATGIFGELPIHSSRNPVAIANERTTPE